MHIQFPISKRLRSEVGLFTPSFVECNLNFLLMIIFPLEKECQLIMRIGLIKISAKRCYILLEEYKASLGSFVGNVISHGSIEMIYI